MGNCVCRPPRSPSESVVASAIAAAAAEGAARLVRAPSSLERKATTTTTTTPLEVDRARVDGVGDDDDDDDDDDDASSYRSGRSSFASDDDDDDDDGGGGDRGPSLARSPRNATTTTTTTKTTLALAQPAPPPDTTPAMDARVAQLLASASEHLEDDAIERLCDDGDDGDAGAAAAATTTTTTTTTKKKTKRKGALARVARVASGMRMMRSMTKAARAAGGSLDLTAFAGTPIRWHARTSVLRTHAVGESSLKPPAAAGAGGPASTRPPPRGSPGEQERRRPRATRLFTQLQRDFGARSRSRALREAARARGIAGEADRSRDDGDGGDGDGGDERKSKFSSPFFAVERQHSIEALEDFADLEDDHAAWDNVSVDYGDDGEVHGEVEVEVDVDADEARDVDVATTVPPPASTPEGRILRVVRALLADAEPPAHLQKPFNPVLGETARHELHLANGVEIRSVLEQVTHHPPVTAFHRREARVRPLPARRAPFASPSVRRSLRLAARMHSFQRD